MKTRIGLCTVAFLVACSGDGSNEPLGVELDENDTCLDSAGTHPTGGGDSDPTGDDSADPGIALGDAVPLFDETTMLNAPIVEDTASALVTRFADRGRDRHARESSYQSYEHYLSWYWEDRTIGVTVTDTVGRSGSTIRFDIVAPHKLSAPEARFFYRGIGTVAEYCLNVLVEPAFPDGTPMPMDQYLASHPDQTHYYFVELTGYQEPLTCAPTALARGQRIEIEISQFLDAPNNGRSNYYGTTFLYIAGEGLVPWESTGAQPYPGPAEPQGVSADSLPIPTSRRLGGGTTIHRNESDEPDNLFMQMATNTAPENAQPFMRGRRLVHSSFVDGAHDENPVENPPLPEVAGLSAPAFAVASCNGCHVRNGRALPADPGAALPQWVFRVGDEFGNPDPNLGVAIQPQGLSGGPGEGVVTLAAWREEAGLRWPEFAYGGHAPSHVSARISPQLVGMGLLEAIVEDDIAALADPEDHDRNGISGRMHLVQEVGGPVRLGRFGYKATQPTVRQQVASALRNDMGVTTSLFPTHDCGSTQSGCSGESAELSDEQLDELALYISLLGVQAQAEDSSGGGVIFDALGCAECHTPSFQTSPFAPLSELRDQTIHPYTDLLLHDMGEGLADTLVDGDAGPQEWRTAPLWGLGKSAGVSGGTFYLHDGRARSIDEAIRWHGGEAAAAKSAYERLSAADRDALLAFLGSL